MRQDDHLIAVGKMRVDEVVQQRPLQPRAEAAVDPEAGAGQPRAAFIVDQPQIGAQIDMVLRLKIKMMRLAVVAQRLVVLLAARLEIGVRQIRQRQHQCAVLRLDVRQLLVVLGDLGLPLGHAREDRRDVLARLLALRDLLGNAVLLGLVRFLLEDQRAALCVQLQDPIDLRVAVHFLGPQTGLDPLGIVFDSFNIQHFQSPLTLDYDR